jgi:molybdate transport system ATP-binding protein
VSETPTLSIDLKLPLQPFTLRCSATLAEQVTGLFGPSGSGKTSLVETITGLRRNAKGRIVFGDTVWMDSDQNIFLPPEQRGIGFVPQRGLLFPHLNVRQNLLFGSKRAKPNAETSAQASRDLFDQVVDILNLGELLHRKPAALSGGERQRVAAGRAVCSNPQLLIMDEPLSSLDLALRYKTLAFFIRLVNDLKLSMIWVSHDAIEVQAICDELIAIERGEFTHRGNPVQVLSNPKVFPTLEFSGFQNVFPCRIVESTEVQTTVRLDGGSAQLILSETIRDQRNESGASAFVTIPARSILISTENPSHVSAGNRLPSTIVRIEPQSQSVAAVLVQLKNQSDQSPLVIELTTAALNRLKLEQGQSVYVLIKSTACVLQTVDKNSTS